MMRDRKQFTAQDKMRFLKRHLVDKVPVLDMCDDRWPMPSPKPRALFERAPGAQRAGPLAAAWDS